MARWQKSTFTPAYESFRKRLAEMRLMAGLTQRQLADKLGREQSFVARIELGERRLDFLEFYRVCLACKVDPHKEASSLLREFKRLDRRR